MNSTRLTRAAELVAAARLEGRRLGALPEESRPRNEAEGYAVQQLVHQLLAEGGWGARVGWKIGCTSPVMQELLGIDHPCAGGVLEQGTRTREGQFDRANDRQLGVECELAVRLRTELRPEDGPLTPERAAAAVGACAAAIEVVDDRYSDFRTLGTPTLIADDFFGAGCVLAQEVELDPSRLKEAELSMTIDGRQIGSGRGSDILGDPLIALAWLATVLAEQGRGLRAGDFVLLGSVVPVQWIEGGEVVVASDLLGEACARI